LTDSDNTTAEPESDVDYLTRASNLAELLDGDAYTEIASAIAIQYIESGELEQGVQLAEQIADVYVRDSLLAAATAKAVASGNDDFATELLEMIEDPLLRNSAIEGMAIEFAKCGEFDAALGLADELSDNASALAAIAAMYWQSGQKNEAVDLARSIEFTQQSATTLVQLARMSDDKDESLSLLAEARRVAEEVESGEVKVLALLAIASGCEEHGDREQALEALNRAVEVCNDFETAHLVGLSADFAKDELLVQIVEGFISVDDVAKATDVAEEIEDRFVFARASLSLAVARGKGQEPGEIKEYLDEAQAIIFESEAYGQQEANVRDGLLIDLAMAYANAGEYAEARRIIQSVMSDETRVLALKELGKLCRGAGNDQEVVQIEQPLISVYDKAQYWIGIYDSMTSNQPELSDPAMAEALAFAEVLEQPLEKAEAFTVIGMRFARSQKTTEAESAFLRASTAANLIDGNYLKARAFLRLAKASHR